MGESKSFIEKILLDKLAIREFSKFVRETEVFFNSCGDDISFALCSVDGQEYKYGSDSMLLNEYSILLNTALAMMNDIDVSNESDGAKTILNSFQELRMISLLAAGREVTESMDFMHAQYNNFMSFGGLRVEYQNYIKLREAGHLDKSNGYILKGRKIFQSESEMKKGLDVLWQTKSIRLNLLPFVRFAALLASGGMDWYSSDEIFTANIPKTILCNLDQRNIHNDEQSRKLFHDIGMPFFMTSDNQSITLVVPTKFAITIKSEFTDLTTILKKFCKKFHLHRFENTLCVRSFTKSVEEKVNISKYHLFLCVAENNIDEVKLYNEENSAFLLQRDHNNRSLLHLAASRGHIDMVKLLVDFQGGTVYQNGYRVSAPKTLQIPKKFLFCLYRIKLLYPYQLDPNIVDKRNRTPLDDAIYFKHVKVSDYLKGLW